MSVNFLGSSLPHDPPKVILNDEAYSQRVIQGAFEDLTLKDVRHPPDLIIFDSPGITDDKMPGYAAWMRKVFERIEVLRSRDAALMLLSRERKGGPFFKGVVDSYLALEAGWEPYRQFLWDKQSDYFRPRYPFQIISIFRKGEMPSQATSPIKYKDVLRMRDVSKTRESTVSELPEGIIGQLLTLFPVSSVLDPFGGSGTTAVACLHADLPCTTVELDPPQAEEIRARLEQEIIEFRKGTKR